MAIPELEALSVANNISANTSKAQYNKTKNQLQKSEIGIKKAQLLGSLPSSTDVAGDVMMGGANSMAQSPRNGMTGLVEGLLRAFGGSLKGKAADERRQQIMDSLDVLDYTMQGEEYLKNTQQQIAKQQEDMQYRPSQKQYEQSYSDGTIDQTLKATFQQMGIDPNKVQRSSDGLNVYIEKDGKITKAPVSDFFSPEDSQKFQFINSTQKANLAQSENKQVQGLAQENNMLKSRLDVLEEQYKQIEGISPVMAKSLARGVVEGERVQQNEDAMKERGFSLQERGLGIQQQNANISQDYLNLEKQYAPQKYEVAKSRIDETSRRNDIMEGRVGEAGFKRVEAAKQKYLPKIEAAGRVEAIINKIRPIVEKHPEALQSVLNVVWNNDDDGIITGTIKSLTQQQTNNETAQAIAELGKYTNELKIGVVKGLSNPNQFIDRIVAGTIPGKNMPPQSFLKILQDMELKAQQDRKINTSLLNEAAPIYGKESNNYGDKYNEIIENYVEESKPKEDMVTVINPQGITGKIPKTNLEKALNSGYKVMQ